MPIVRIGLTKAERLCCEEMQRRGGWPTIEGLVRTSLYRMARHLDLDPPVHWFPAFNTPRRRRRSAGQLWLPNAASPRPRAAKRA